MHASTGQPTRLTSPSLTLDATLQYYFIRVLALSSGCRPLVQATVHISQSMLSARTLHTAVWLQNGQTTMPEVMSLTHCHRRSRLSCRSCLSCRSPPLGFSLASRTALITAHHRPLLPCPCPSPRTPSPARPPRNRPPLRPAHDSPSSQAAPQADQPTQEKTWRCPLTRIPRAGRRGH